MTSKIFNTLKINVFAIIYAAQLTFPFPTFTEIQLFKNFKKILPLINKNRLKLIRPSCIENKVFTGIIFIH